MHHVGGITVEYVKQGEPLRSAANYTVSPPAVRGMANDVPFTKTLDRAERANVAAPAVPSAYTVKKGDNLSRIVQNHLQDLGKPADNLAVYDGIRTVSKANGIQDPNLIFPGQQIDLSPLGGMVTVAPQAKVETPAPLAPPAPAAEQIETRELPPPLLKASSSRLHAPKAEAPVIAQTETIPSENTEKVVVAKHTAPPLVPRTGIVGEGGPEDGVVSHAKHLAKNTRDLSERLTEVMTPAIDATSRPASPWSRTLGGPARLTSGYGVRKDPFTGHRAFHHGIDLAAPRGTEIYPFDSGTVTFNGWKSGYGRVVVVEHDNGLESYYGHTAKNHVTVGARVDRDTVIAEVGSTGRSTGPHLHFEVRRDGKSVNPLPYLQHTRVQTAQR